MSTNMVLYVLLGALAILLAWIVRLEIRLSRLLAGKSARTLEDTIVRLRDELTKLFDHKNVTDKRLDQIDGRVKKSVQWVETIRFNPFRDQGSNQSWSTLFVNENGDGVVMTGIYSRDKSSVYAKPVKNRGSEYELSDEEKELLRRVK